jgi:hypothetical protein
LFLIKKIFAFSGRRYGYGKRKIKKDILPIPHKRLPLCSGGCTRQLIAPECREETFGFEHGMECRGCPIDICRGQLPIGGGNIGLNHMSIKINRLKSFLICNHHMTTNRKQLSEI